MKKLISLLLLTCLLINVQAQLKINDPQKLIDHALVGFAIQSALELGGYKLLSEKTNLPLFWCKTLSKAPAFFITWRISEFKEKTDSFRNPNDIKYTMRGAVFGSIFMTGVLYVDIPLSRLNDRQRQDLKLNKNYY